jgi:hypothetical protein
MKNFEKNYQNIKIYPYSYFEPKRIKPGSSKEFTRQLSDYRIEPHTATGI